MSKVSIYEISWMDLVFENKNKSYGAYQLRQESVKSSAVAFLLGLTFVGAVSGFFQISNYLNSPTETQVSCGIDQDRILHISRIQPPVKPKVTQLKIPPQAAGAVKTIKEKQLKNPVVVSSTIADNVVPFTKNTITSENHNIPASTLGTGSSTGTTEGSNLGAGTASLNTNVDTGANYGNSIVTSSLLDKSPQFPGGIDEFYKYVSENFEKPELADLNNVKIFVSFVVEKDGSMSDIRVLKDPGYGLGKEAIRVLKSIKTKWSPGSIKSQSVRTSYNLPIVIQFE